MTTVLRLRISEPDRADDDEEDTLAAQRGRNDRALRALVAEVRTKHAHKTDPRHLFDDEYACPLALGELLSC